MARDEGDDESGGRLNKIRGRYAVRIGVMVLAVTAVLLALGYVTFTNVQASVQSDAEDSLASAAEREAAGIADFVESRNNDTRRISSNGDLTGMTAPAARSELERELRRLPESVVAIHLYDTVNGSIDASTESGAEESPGRATISIQTLADVQDRLTGPGDVRSFDPYEVDRQQLLGFTSIVDDGEENHVVVVVVDLASRSRILTSPIDGSGVEIVSHSTGEVVLGQNPESIFQRPAYLDDLAYLQTGGYSGTRVDLLTSQSALVDDDELVVAASPVENKRWSVVVVASQSSALATVGEVTRSLLLLIGVALLGLLLVGAVITRDINKSLSKTTSYAAEIEKGNLDVDIDTTRADEFGQLSGQFARLRDALKDQIRSSEQARKEAEVARAEAEELANYLQEKAEEYSEVMQQVSAGDLTQRMEQDGEEEAMDRIADEFNDMIEELEKTTGQLKSYVDEVEEAGESVEQSATTVREASEQVAESIQRISDDAYNQQERLEGVQTTINEVANALASVEAEHDTDLDDTLTAVREAAASLEAVVELSEETMAESQEVAGAAEEQAAELNTVSERAHDLQQYAQPLRDILERFETEKEHEFVFSVGPTGGGHSLDGDQES